MKKVICVILFLVVLVYSSVFASEANVQLNGETLDFTDSNGQKVNAQIINNRTMVPLRKIFEVLGCEIEWEESTKTVTATKDNTKIVLQINNNIATKTVNGVEEKLTLDTAPVLLNNRTLVPLRFVAESLDKQVGWEASSYTAIIIDYDYFANLLKQKNVNLYNLLTSNSNNISFEITRSYTDTANASNNNTATLKGSISSSNQINANLNFVGNNDLIEDLSSENLSNVDLVINIENERMIVTTQNAKLSERLEQNTFTPQDLKLKGYVNDNLGNGIRNIFDVEDGSLNSNSFKNMKADFENFLSLFVANGTHKISYENSNFATFDYTNFDNVIFDNDLVKVLSVLNSRIFNYDITRDEILFDWPSFNYEINCQNNNLLLKITLENDYNERVAYDINISAN